jgi:hypothetical protein
VESLRGDDYDILIVLRPAGGPDTPPIDGVPAVLYWSFGPLDDPTTVSPDDRLAAARRMRDELRTRVGFFVNVTTPH